LCQILNPAKMQKIPEIPRFTTFQTLKFTHSIPRRPSFLDREGEKVATIIDLRGNEGLLVKVNA